jgi:Na+-transporting NADH:ubiquinone oxidoreductase subunit A
MGSVVALMPVHRISRGLQLPITGQPSQVIEGGPAVARAALLGSDYLGMRPTMHVDVGATVERGQVLFDDKKTPGVRYTAPVAGTVTAINRGERRAFESLVITLSDEERAGRGRQVTFGAWTGRPVGELSGEQVRNLLLESGLWPTLRARPFSKVADPAVQPRSIFVTAIDTDPLAPDVDVVMQGRSADLEAGLVALTKLTEGPVFLCTSAKSSIVAPRVDRVRHEQFDGPHPAGTVGLHVHRLDPVGRERVVWHVGYQNLLAIGRLFSTGQLETRRVVALAGPSVQKPRLVETVVGASTDELLAGGLAAGENRVLSGSVLSGRTAIGPVHGYLGRFHNQIAVLPEGREREFMGWAGPGLSRFSVTGAFLSKLRPGARFPMTTSTNGSHRAIVPIGLYEKVMPLDMEATFLLKALVTRDLERAEQLGCLELDEEDLALCTFVCPSKNEYGPALREVLAAMEKEG